MGTTMLSLRRLWYNQNVLKLNNKFKCSSAFGTLSECSRSRSSKMLQPPLVNSDKNKTSIILNIQRNLAVKNMAHSNEEFRHLDYEQLIEQKKKENTILIDVREKHEVDETGVLPGAHHIPLGDVDKALKASEDEFKGTYNFTKPSETDEIVFSCRSGKRSLAALEKALANGYTNAKHYKGGWLDWEKQTSESK